MSTFEGPMMSIKTVNALSHYTDWTIGHVHAGALGWVALITIGSLYYLIPRMFGQTQMYSVKADRRCTSGSRRIGIVLYIAAMWIAGVMQGLMWRAINADGTLTYTFVESVKATCPFYVVRLGGGLLFLAGMLRDGLERRDDRSRSGRAAAVPRSRAWPTPEGEHVPWLTTNPQRSRAHRDQQLPDDRADPARRSRSAAWSRSCRCSSSARRRSRSPGLKPYTALQLAGRDVYMREGCYNCHSQMIRPLRAETERYGHYSVAGEFVYDHPFQWGSKRTGPDLARVGGRYTDDWHRAAPEQPARRGARIEHAGLPVAGARGDRPGQRAAAACARCAASACRTPTPRSPPAPTR